MSKLFLFLFCVNVVSFVLFQLYNYVLNASTFNYNNSFISSRYLNTSESTNIVQQFKDITYVQKSSDYLSSLPRPPFIFGIMENDTRSRALRCAPFPSFVDIEFSNVIWQLQKQENWTFHLFGAYWDVRIGKELNMTDDPAIRILGMVNKRSEAIEKNYCQIWFENQTRPLIVKVISYNYLWLKQWGHYDDHSLQPYLITCPMPKNYSGRIPTSVSLSPTPCTPATNNLRVHFDKPEKKEMFAVCVKGMDFILTDLSARLIEWIELLYIFGVSKIYFYEFAVHPNMKKVLTYYENLNRIEVIPLTNAGGVPNEPHLRHIFFKAMIASKRHQELIPYNDCLYRNMYKYKYISLLDIDEIIVPHNDNASNWVDLVRILEKNNSEKCPPYFVFSKAYFASDLNVTNSDKELGTIPDYLYMLQHITRNSQDDGIFNGIKCFHPPENMLTVHNHFPRECISKCHCSKVTVNLSDGMLHHYGYRYPTEIDILSKVNVTYVTDPILRKWKTELIERSQKVLHELKFI